MEVPKHTMFACGLLSAHVLELQAAFPLSQHVGRSASEVHDLCVTCLVGSVLARVLTPSGVAGAEALFADLGHFNRHAMQLSTLCMVHTPPQSPKLQLAAACRPKRWLAPL